MRALPSRRRVLRRRYAEHLPEPMLRWLLRVRHAETPAMSRARQTLRRVANEPSGVPVRDFDAEEVARGTAAGVVGALERHKIPYVAVPGPHETVRSLAVATEHR